LTGSIIEIKGTEMDKPNIANEFKQAIGTSGKHAAPLILGSEGRYSLEYVPFEHVNAEARLVIVGITPGPNQRNEAYDETRQLLRRGMTDEDRPGCRYSGSIARVSSWAQPCLSLRERSIAHM
jgi:hypothetical protein